MLLSFDVSATNNQGQSLKSGILEFVVLKNRLERAALA
jgi:hypothetical protein